jgi:hypothetical protein
MKPHRSARAGHFLVRRFPRLSTRTSAHRTLLAAITGLLVVLQCVGCIGPFRRGKACESCGGHVSEGASCETPVCGDGGQCHCCRDGVICRTSRAIVHTVCCPYRCCCRAVNFCVPRSAVGPCDVEGPGRFHPVPTHPVVEPEPEQVAYPDDWEVTAAGRDLNSWRVLPIRPVPTTLRAVPARGTYLPC